MTTETETTVSTWLSTNIDSHGIYGTELLAELPAPVAYDPTTDTLRSVGGGRSVKLGALTAAEFDRRYGAVAHGDPKGAYLDPVVDPTLRMFGGYWLSSALDRLLTGEDAGAQYNGRGFAHRARVAHLAAAGY